VLAGRVARSKVSGHGARESRLLHLTDRWRAAADLVAAHRDVLEGRPGTGDGEPPKVLVERGWDAFLLSLDDVELDAIEAHGHDAPWPERAPAALRSLLEAAREVCALPALPLTNVAAGPQRPARRGENPRKLAQVEAFGRLVTPLAARSSRVVDVGSGHGHLTRDLAERIALPVVGLERDAALAGRARTLSSESPVAAPLFAVTDVLRDGLALEAGDCVTGLHACGELGDVMVTSVARCHAASLALVGCCLQKRRQLSRRPLSSAPGHAEALELPRSMLGLSNLAAGDDGIEATRADNLAARERRLALNRLLSAGGEPLRFGAEIEGMNRRMAQRELPPLAERAFALRGRPSPSRAALDEAAAWARSEHARARRLSVPRALLARPLEVYVLLDRAVYLAEHGLSVEIGTLFPARISPRNLALVAQGSGVRVRESASALH
jgi:hypothetical protein